MARHSGFTWALKEKVATRGVCGEAFARRIRSAPENAGAGLVIKLRSSYKEAMRHPRDHKEQTRRRILDAAASVFRKRGYQAAGVDAVMHEAGLTAGAFYAHFDSKEALFAQTLPHALRHTRLFNGPGLDHLSGADWLRAVAAIYLSPAHRRTVEQGCPLPALLPEVARASGEAKQAVEEALLEVAGKIAARLPHREGGPADGALAVLALLVGGMTLARAVADESLGDRILAACRDLADKAAEQPVKRSRRKTTRTKKGKADAREDRTGGA
jgi:TetR/AcrR family transcriptional repressor of nem operon